MNKKNHLLALLICLLASFTLTSCGNDDEPKISSVSKSDLTTPWLLIDVENSTNDKIRFYAFDDKRVAYGILSEDKEENVFIEDAIIYSSWELNGKKLTLGANVPITVEKVSRNGVYGFQFGNIIYIPSNVIYQGVSIEDAFKAYGISRASFWTMIEKARIKN